MRTFTKIDFGSRAGKVKPWLHCAGFAPTIVNRNPIYEDAIRSLNLKATRTHDWALTNSGQRVIDTHFIFPLLHLDARDPRNYIFEPTDRIISLSRDMGLKIFYRLGTSIEHTGKDWGFNTLTPKDIDNYAEALAGIVRHYTQGWANGFKWDIEYWELFNEPDKHSCWRGDGEEFIKLFVTCLKRLKSEFPKLKIGGPALAAPKKQYIANLLEACRAEGVVPDFISWHLYSSDPREVVGQVDEIRKLAAEVDIIPRVHGSAMFTRGQTQICNVCTLAPLSESTSTNVASPFKSPITPQLPNAKSEFNGILREHL